MEPGVLLAGGSVVVGAIVWLVRLEGRIAGHDHEHLQHQARHDEMRADLAYIRDRIDRALNGKH
jgi:hypothetical protein